MHLDGGGIDAALDADGAHVRVEHGVTYLETLVVGVGVLHRHDGHVLRRVPVRRRELVRVQRKDLRLVAADLMRPDRRICRRLGRQCHRVVGAGALGHLERIAADRQRHMVIVEDPHARGDALPLGPVPRARHHAGAHRTGRLVCAVVFGGDDQRRADLARCDCHGSRGRTRDHGRGLIDLDADRKLLRQIATSPQRDQDVAAFHDARARGRDRDQRHARRGHDVARFAPQRFRVAGVVVQAHLDLQLVSVKLPLVV